MHSRSFKQALRATVGACIVASAFAGISYADWKSPAYPMAITCLVHDSGAEFLPPSLWQLEPEAPSPELATLTESSEPVTALLDPVEDCAKFAIRLDNQQLAMHAATQAKSRARSYWNATSESALALYQRIANTWRVGTKATGGMFADWANRAADIATNPFVEDFQAIDSPLTTDTQSFASEFRGCTISTLEQDASWDRMPSGLNPNIFVFTLESMGPLPSNSEPGVAPEGMSSSLEHVMKPAMDTPMRPRLSDQIFARDYCVFAPESVVEDPTPAPNASRDVVRPSHQAMIQMQRNGSRQLARGMQWLGNAMLRWSSDLESSVRIAEASDGPSFDDR